MYSPQTIIERQPITETSFRFTSMGDCETRHTVDDKYFAICKRVDTFHKNGWRFTNRSDFQTPLAFAEAGFECVGSDKVICKRCNTTFKEWELQDVPLTEHKKIVECPFIKELVVEEAKHHPHVRYACDKKLSHLSAVLEQVRKKPSILNEPLDKFLNTLGSGSQLHEEIQWIELLHKYQ